MTLSRVVEHAMLRKPRNQPNVASDFNHPNFTHLQPSNLSKNSCSSEPRELLISRKPKKMLFSVRFLGLGCKGVPMSATEPTIVRSSADWETEKRRRRRQGRKTHNRARTPANVDICCAPPGISFACDVIPSTSPRHVQHSRVARRSRNINYIPASSQGLSNPIFARSHSSSARQYRHLHHHSRRGISEEVNAIFGSSIDEDDQYRNWRLNVDSVLYEELLELSDKIGYAGRGLREEEIFRCLRIFKPSDFQSDSLLISIDKEWRCSICQDGCRETDGLGRLGCGHCHHIDCIKHWLRLKNECPVCKTAPIADK